MIHPIRIAAGVFMMTMIMIAFLLAMRDITDLTNKQMPFTRGWYTAVYMGEPLGIAPATFLSVGFL